MLPGANGSLSTDGVRSPPPQPASVPAASTATTTTLPAVMGWPTQRTHVTVGRYAWGVAALLITVGSVGLVGVLLRRHWLPDWDGARARLAESLIGLATLIALIGDPRSDRLAPPRPDRRRLQPSLRLWTHRAVGTPRRDRTRVARAGATRGANRLHGRISASSWRNNDRGLGGAHHRKLRPRDPRL